MTYGTLPYFSQHTFIHTLFDLRGVVVMFISDSVPFWNVTYFCEGKHLFWWFWTRFCLIGVTPWLTFLLFFVIFLSLWDLVLKRGVISKTGTYMTSKTTPDLGGNPKLWFLTKTLLEMRLWLFAHKTALFWTHFPHKTAVFWPMRPFHG